MGSTWVSPIIFAKILCYTGAVSKSAFADPDGSIKSYVPVNIASGVLVMFGVTSSIGSGLYPTEAPILYYSAIKS